MRTLLRLLLLLPCMAGPLANASPVLQIEQPVYVWIDGRYYVMDVPLGQDGSPTGPARVHARGSAGFFLHGFLTARNCTRADGTALPIATPLKHDEVLDAPAAQSVPLRAEAAGPKVRIVWCSNLVILALRTSSGDAICQGAVVSPVSTGACPALDGLLTSPAPTGRIFYNGFDGG